LKKTMNAQTFEIKLRPLEPYFFGGETTFSYLGIDNEEEKQRAGGYYIQSLDTPSQTTLFGALRYLGIRKPSSDYNLCDDDKKRIGGASYRLTDGNADFGEIIG